MPRWGSATDASSMGPMDLLNISTGSISAQIDLLEAQMSAIAAQNAALEQNILPGRGSPLSPLRPPSEPPQKEAPEDEILERKELVAASGFERQASLERQCEQLEEQLKRAKEEAEEQQRHVEHEGKLRAQQVQLVCEQLREQVARSEQEAWTEVVEARQREARVLQENEELRAQLAQALEQLSARDLDASQPLGTNMSISSLDLLDTRPDVCPECHSVKEEAKQWRRMVLDEQEKNSQLQERLLEAVRAERAIRRAERERRWNGPCPDEFCPPLVSQRGV